MTRFTDIFILEKMKATGLIPVFNHRDLELSWQVVKACYDAGLRVFEFTNRGDNAFHTFNALAKRAREYEDLVMGIGTIFTMEDARKYHRAGAQFIVSPAFIPEIAAYSQKEQLLWVPGCGTITEVYNAYQLGALLIKVFPGNVLGPTFVKSVKDVLPNTNLMPTGGVSGTIDNLSGWFNAGSCCVGMGSQLIRKELLADKNFGKLAKEIKEVLAIISTIRI